MWIARGLAVVLAAACACLPSQRHTVGASYDEVDADVKSARRTFVSGRVFRECPLDPRPASFVRVELVERSSNEILTSATTDHSGLFTLRSEFLYDPSARVYLRLGPYRVDLPSRADASYEARLLVPCGPPPETPALCAGLASRGLEADALPGLFSAECRPGVPEQRVDVEGAPAASRRALAAGAPNEQAPETLARTLTSVDSSGMRASVGIDVLFELDSSRVSALSLPELAAVAEALSSPSLALSRVIVGGYADATGEAAYNQALSLRRAESVKRVLVERYGISSARLLTIGHGEEEPRATNSSAKGRALNRHVTLTLAEPDT